MNGQIAIAKTQLLFLNYIYRRFTKFFFRASEICLDRELRETEKTHRTTRRLRLCNTEIESLFRTKMCKSKIP